MNDEFKQYLTNCLREGLEEELAKAPWWCMICGEGGNYEGERPDEYWFPPVDHECNFDDAKEGTFGWNLKFAQGLPNDEVHNVQAEVYQQLLNAQDDATFAEMYRNIASGFKPSRPGWMDEVEAKCWELTREG